MNDRAQLSVVVALAITTGCQKERWDDCFTPVGSITMDERQVAGFTSIDIGDKINLVITPDQEDRLVLEAGDRLLEQIRTEVVGNTLMIRNENTCNWVRRLDVPITVHVWCAALDEITYRGTGDISSTDTITGPLFRFYSENGAGRVDLLLNVAGCYIGLFNGSTDVTVSGSCIEAWFYTFGFGRLGAAGFRTQKCHPHSNSSGMLTCHASDQLYATIDNIGDIYYAGNPSEVHSTIVGTGQLIGID